MVMFEEQYLSNQSEPGHAVLRVLDLKALYARELRGASQGGAYNSGGRRVSRPGGANPGGATPGGVDNRAPPLDGYGA